jgi:DNA-binding MarR family transcriptional regulator
MATTSRNTYGHSPKSAPRKRTTRPFIMLDVATYDDLRQDQKIPETHLVTLLGIKALMGPREVLCVYDPRHPDSSLYTRLEGLRHRHPVTLQRHVAALKARGLVETFTDPDNPGHNSCLYLRLTLPGAARASGKKRVPFIRIDLSLMRYCRLLVRCTMPKDKEGWETVFVTWVALKRFENRKTGLCCPAYATLAESRGRHRMTVIRHVGVLRAAGIIHRDRNPFATRRHRVRYRSNYYTLLAPGALIRFENNEVVFTNIPNLKRNLNPYNQIENNRLYQSDRGEEKTPNGCVHTPHHAIMRPMWECRACGEIFEAAIG